MHMQRSEMQNLSQSVFVFHGFDRSRIEHRSHSFSRSGVRDDRTGGEDRNNNTQNVLWYEIIIFPLEFLEIFSKNN